MSDTDRCSKCGHLLDDEVDVKKRLNQTVLISQMCPACWSMKVETLLKTGDEIPMPRLCVCCSGSGEK